MVAFVIMAKDEKCQTIGQEQGLDHLSCLCDVLPE